jgi:GDP-D-mannose dehydratase
LKKKTALITGICGMDGSYIADMLLEKNYNVIGVMRRNATRDLGNAKHLEDKIDIVEGDITDMSSILRIIQSTRPHELYNMAAQSHVHTSFEQPLATLDIDTKGVVNILECIRSLGYSTRLLHASTSELFGSSPPSQDMNTPFMPESPYAIAKLASHHFIRLYRKAYKMYCCAAVTFNHECFFSKTPIILRKNNEIDIVYINSLVSNRKDIIHDNSQLTKNYENSNIEVWDGIEFVELKAVSRKKLKTLDRENQYCQITNAPASSVFTTPNHNLIDNDNKKRHARSFTKNQTVKIGNFPKITDYKDVSCIYAKILGLLCGDGYVSDKDFRLINNNDSIQQDFINSLKKLYCGINYKIKTYTSGFNGKSTRVEISGLGQNQCSLFREMIYDKKTKHKKVPSIILNSSIEAQKSFLHGYFLADGLKAGYETYEFSSFKTNSPLLAQGILLLINNVTGQSFNINCFEYNEKIYHQINLHSPDNPHSFGNHLKIQPNKIKKIINREENNQHVFDIETGSGKIMAGIGIPIVGNSERRGPNFVTRKISMGVAQCLKDPDFKLKLGNLDAQRDWGYAPDYVRGFWTALQQGIPDDYIFATGEMHSVKEFCEIAFSHVGLNWEDHVEVDRFYMRPSEVDALCGDYSETKEKLGWEPKVKFEELVKKMVDYDCQLLGVKNESS